MGFRKRTAAERTAGLPDSFRLRVPTAAGRKTGDAVPSGPGCPKPRRSGAGPAAPRVAAGRAQDQGSEVPLHGGTRAPEGGGVRDPRSARQPRAPRSSGRRVSPGPPARRAGTRGRPPSRLPTARTRPLSPQSAGAPRASPMETPPPSAQDRRPPRRPRQPAARRLAASRGGPPARGGAGALAEGRRRRRLKGLTKPTRRRSATYSTARVVMETHQLKPAAIGSVRASSEEGGGARPRRPTRGPTEDGERGPSTSAAPSASGPAPGLAPLPALRQICARARRRRTPPAASHPSRPCGGHAHDAAGHPWRPRALPGPAAGPRTRTTPQVLGPPATAALRDTSFGARAGACWRTRPNFSIRAGQNCSSSWL
ncbi:proline-rich protein 2-like [Mustela erminea]|uniref:proline-rich protein 2-like n=1 Tax=Mustela erminea TaxID=36723 RepID=UPI001386641F|nr:proline-rich protein 2-like [Mustela erminea]XP_032209214.1 proline-rich protein 2-like [Mustela erminea]XP_032209215.1 proline-rich protein 2-like [Mustela erminea]XP_032209216.1 proline-rich protein 2-like [Mustela erminea]XP_032209217.1 proline-rich protein 2-like [Mustela erminea]XP_032209218.1 proline-rich protein 2-like [Mustela erminea]XP_032209219.1 proline-rich protein 2-like [Mustela erminea]XP_032209220.1 proline-rich protein 2-like [Mustela erminea]